MAKAVNNTISFLMSDTANYIAGNVAGLVVNHFMIPKPPKGTEDNHLQAIRSSVQPHRMIYGRVKVGGTLVYARSHDQSPWESPGPYSDTDHDQGRYLTLVVAIAGHEIEEIEEVWINDKISDSVIFADDDPTDDDLPALKITKYLGTQTQQADPFLCSLPAFPESIIFKAPQSGLNDLRVFGDYSGTGQRSYSVKISTAGAQDYCQIRENTWPNGDGVLVPGEWGAPVAIVADQNIALGYGISANFNAQTGHDFGQEWEIRAFDGLPWDSSCKLTGIAYLVVSLGYSQEAYPTGLPNITAVVKGNNKVYDPRVQTSGYTDNWALCVRDYLAKSYGLNSPADDINDTSFIAAANICDELVELGNGTTQKRYTCNGTFNLDKTPLAIMQEILATASGALVWSQGQYSIFPAVYYPPDLTFHGMNANVPGLTESDLRGAIKVRTSPSLKEKFNAVTGTYVSPETWQPVDFPKVKNALYKSEDGGEEITRDVALAYVTDSVQAQRVAKIMLERSRQGIVVDFPAKWSAFPLSVMQTVPVTIARLGWDQKLFSVREWKLAEDGGVDLALQEEAEGVYDWNNGEETTHDLAQNTKLPNPRLVTPPTGLLVTESLYTTAVAKVPKIRCVLSWDNHPTAAGYKVLLDGRAFSAPAKATSYEFADVQKGSRVFSIAARNALGVWSDYASITVTVDGKTDPPATPLDFAGTVINGDVALTWSRVADPDIDYYELRVGSSWALGAEIGTTTSKRMSWRPPAAGTYTFYLKAVDTSANQSGGTATCSVTVTADDLRTINDLSQGLDGYNTARVYIYKRATSTPALPSATSTYTFSTGGISGLNNGWTLTIPTGADQLYVSAATAIGRTGTDDITAAEWASPVPLSATPGADGQNGLSAATVFLFQRTATNVAPAIPSITVTYTFATGEITGSIGTWSRTVPATGGGYLWVTQATAISTASTDTIANTEWAAPVLMAKDGQDGQDGQSGTSTAEITLFKRTTTSTAPTFSTTGSFTYTFANRGIANYPTGWTYAIPAASQGPFVWAIRCRVSGTGATVTVANTEWTGPSLVNIAPEFFQVPVGNGFYQDSTHLGYFKNSAWTSYMDINGNLLGCTLTTDGLKAGIALIDTLLIAGQAITIPLRAYTAAALTCPADQYTQVQTLTIASTGAPIAIEVGAVLRDSGNPNADVMFKVMRGATVLVESLGPTQRSAFGFPLGDTPGNGTFTYTLHFKPSGDIITAANRTIRLLETKK